MPSPPVEEEVSDFQTGSPSASSRVPSAESIIRTKEPPTHKGSRSQDHARQQSQGLQEGNREKSPSADTAGKTVAIITSPTGSMKMTRRHPDCRERSRSSCSIRSLGARRERGQGQPRHLTECTYFVRLRILYSSATDFCLARRALSG